MKGSKFDWDAFHQGIGPTCVNRYAHFIAVSNFEKSSMRKLKRFLAVSLITICLALNSCSQSKNSTAIVSFVATTPCDDISKSLLHIPSADKAEMMKWNLTILTPTTYKLAYTYGMAKQGTRGFSEGAITKEQTGKWSKSKDKNTEIYTLVADNSPSLSFLKLNDNVLHLLDANKNLMVGNGAWSYTLNRINPVQLSPNETRSQKVEETILTDSMIFEGRMPCYAPLLALSGKSTAGCNLVKCRLIFYGDTNSNAPSFLKFYSIHVGTGGTRYLSTGKWTASHGTKVDPNAILYQLQFASEESREHLTFLKGDDNILFLLDPGMNCMAGNDYCSYTLNRVKK